MASIPPFDPRVLMLISRTLDHGVYCPDIQRQLVQCFALVFGATEWWQAMLASEPALAALVHDAHHSTVH